MSADRFDEMARKITNASGCEASQYGRLRDRIARALRQVAADEREACAKIAEKKISGGIHMDGPKGVTETVSTSNVIAEMMVQLAQKSIASAIRARATQEVPK